MKSNAIGNYKKIEKPLKTRLKIMEHLEELIALPDWSLPIQGAEIIAKIRLLMTEHSK